MKTELTYVLITPYTLLKSRTGGIIARLLAVPNIELVGARMFAPSDEFVERYCETLQFEQMPDYLREALRAYIHGNFRRDNRFGISNRTMLLLFRGVNAVRNMHDNVVGPISPHVKGDTVRGTYGDLVLAGRHKAFEDRQIEFFEPAVLTPTCAEANRRQLALLSEFAMRDGGILTNVIQFPKGANVETTLVIIKPDNFLRPSSRPGNIIDMFSRTGLYIVGVKLMRMTIEQAEEFYRPLRKIFVEKLRGQVIEKLREAVSKGFEFPVPDDKIATMAETLLELNAEHEFRKIVNYMTGHDILGVKPEGDPSKSLALLYQGENAIQKIRNRLGATNPEKAEAGTVRSIYGYDLMRNGAHASDSPANAERERKIVGLWEEKGPCDIQVIIDEYLAQGG